MKFCSVLKNLYKPLNTLVCHCIRNKPQCQQRSLLALTKTMLFFAFFSKTSELSNFRKNKETRPIVLLHDVRSFLSDIKHYLITNPAINLRKKIEKIVTKPNVDIGKTIGFFY